MSSQSTKRQCLVHQTLLLLDVNRVTAGCRTCGCFPADVVRALTAGQKIFEPRFHECPAAHVLWFFLTPDQFVRIRITSDRFGQGAKGEWIELFEADDGDANGARSGRITLGCSLAVVTRTGRYRSRY